MEKARALLKKIQQLQARYWAAVDQLQAAIRDGRKLGGYFARLDRCLVEAEPFIEELEQVMADRQGPKVEAPFQPEEGGPTVTLAIPQRIFDDLEARFHKIQKAQEALGPENCLREGRFRIEEPAPGYIVFRS